MDKQDEASPCFGQMVFFEMVEKSAFRERLARAALNLGGREADYPIDLAEVVRRLPWRECQSVLTMASLTASAVFRWRSEQEARLIEWAAETGNQTRRALLDSRDSSSA